MAKHSSRLHFFGFTAFWAAAAGLILSGTLSSAASAVASSRGASVSQDSTPQPSPASAAGNEPAADQAPAAQTPQSAPAPEPTPPPAPADSAPAQAPPAATPGQGQPSQATPATESPTAPQSPAPAQPNGAPAAASPSGQPAEITEDEVKKLLVGKQLFLRGGYLDNSLSFNEHGGLVSHSPQGSYTLNGIEIDKVHLTRHKVELEGERYGLHFLGELPYEDPTKAVDRVNITPKKKLVRITIDRELVVKPKKPKKEKDRNKSTKNPQPSAPKTAPPAPATASGSPASNPPPAIAPDSGEAADATDAAGAKAEIAAAPKEERPADPNSVTTTLLPAHANKVLLDAFDKIFAEPFDARMMDAMPGFWKLYYEAAAAKTDYRPKDPGVFRQSAVDQKARLTSRFEPPSNEFAQDAGVAGMCLYHVVIGADGKPGEIAVARPIGFGLDENAVESIRNATFEPAMKDGKPVPVLLDLVVQFRIYSKRTNVASAPQTPGQSVPILPGPYSVERH